VIVRQQERDAAVLIEAMRQMSPAQSDLFLLIGSFLRDYETLELQDLRDEDVADACASLAATFETSARGVIYEHRPGSLPAERLVSAIKPLLVEARRGGGSGFERDAAFALRTLGQTAVRAHALEPSNRSAFVDLLRRTIPTPGHAAPAVPEAPRLILP
jgi:hypothetical protein